MKKKTLRIVTAVMTASVMLAGCGSSSVSETDTTTTETSQTESETLATEVSTTASAGNASSDYLITNVYGDGQKPWIIVLEYATDIDPTSVSIDDYSVDDYDIEAVYTNTEANIPIDGNVTGKYVLIELSTDYTTSNYTTFDSSSDTTTDATATDSTESVETTEATESVDTTEATESVDTTEATESVDTTEATESTDATDETDSTETTDAGFGGFGGFSMEQDPSNQLTVTWTQTGEIDGTDGTVYAADSESYTTDYSENTNLLVDNFEQDTFTAEDGTTMMYNLYLPEDYDENTSYPVVLFMPDATGEGSDEYLTLTESLGADIWTTTESQEENPCIVLAPQYEDDNTSDPEYTMELLNSIISEYSVDESRLYLVGQSSGTIRSIKLLIDNPDTFAGAMLIAGQAEENSEYEDELAQLADQNIWMICSAGDAKAYPGMTAIADAVEAAGTTVTTSQWSAKLSDEEQNELATEMEESSDSNILWTVFDAGTVMEDDVPVENVTEHMNTWRVAYNLTTVRNWLFDQVNDSASN